MGKLVVRAVAAVAAALVLLGPSWPAGADTSVNHRFTFEIQPEDDICGPYPSHVTFSVRTEVLHYTERADGRFNAHWTQTGTYHVDFVDPTLADQHSQYTDSIHHVFTPGQVEVFNETFHDFPDGIKIWVRVHATFVDGRLVVERVVEKVVGCPS